MGPFQICGCPFREFSQSLIYRGTGPIPSWNCMSSQKPKWHHHPRRGLLSQHQPQWSPAFSGEHAYLWAFKLWTPRRHGFCASYQFFIMNYHHPSTTVILCLSAFLWTSGEWVLRGICVGAFPVEQVWLFSRFGFSSIFDQPLGHIKDPTWFSSIYRGGMETCGTITGVVIRRWRC